MGDENNNDTLNLFKDIKGQVISVTYTKKHEDDNKEFIFGCCDNYSITDIFDFDEYRFDLEFFIDCIGFGWSEFDSADDIISTYTQDLDVFIPNKERTIKQLNKAIKAYKKYGYQGIEKWKEDLEKKKSIKELKDLYKTLKKYRLEFKVLVVKKQMDKDISNDIEDFRIFENILTDYIIDDLFIFGSNINTRVYNKKYIKHINKAFKYAIETTGNKLLELITE